jgi:hypothetical protein
MPTLSPHSPTAERAIRPSDETADPSSTGHHEGRAASAVGPDPSTPTSRKPPAPAYAICAPSGEKPGAAFERASVASTRRSLPSGRISSSVVGPGERKTTTATQLQSGEKAKSDVAGSPGSGRSPVPSAPTTRIPAPVRKYAISVPSGDQTGCTSAGGRPAKPPSTASAKRASRTRPWSQADT